MWSSWSVWFSCQLDSNRLRLEGLDGVCKCKVFVYRSYSASMPSGSSKRMLMKTRCSNPFNWKFHNAPQPLCALWCRGLQRGIFQEASVFLRWACSVALPGIGPSQEWITRTGGPLDLELWGNHGSFLPPLHQFIEIVFTLERQKLHMEGPDLENFYIEVKWITSCTGSCSA